MASRWTQTELLGMLAALAVRGVLRPPEEETCEGSSRAACGEVEWRADLGRWAVCIRDGCIDRSARSPATGEEYPDEESRWWAIPQELLE